MKFPYLLAALFLIIPIAHAGINCGSEINESIILSIGLENCTEGVSIIGDNLVFDCNGYSIEGEYEGVGLFVEGNNITIKNCFFRNFEYGGIINNSQNIFLYSNEFVNNKKDGLIIENSNNSYFERNSFSKNGLTGLRIKFSNYIKSELNFARENSESGVSFYLNSNMNIFENGRLESNGIGISLIESLNNKIVSNKVINNAVGILSVLSSFNRIENNTVNVNGGGIVFNNSNEIINTNEVCNNGKDIAVDYSAGTGNGNRCSIYEGWNDDGFISGCRYKCKEAIECEKDSDCEQGFSCLENSCVKEEFNSENILLIITAIILLVAIIYFIFKIK